jgi:hypothetical protein
MKDHLRFTDKEKDEVLERFMKEFFHFPTLRKAGFFTKEMKGDYKAQAERVCQYFGYKTVFEYGSKEVRCHLSKGGKRTEKFITIMKNIYE